MLFLSISFVLGSQHERSSQWNMSYTFRIQEIMHLSTPNRLSPLVSKEGEMNNLCVGLCELVENSFVNPGKTYETFIVVLLHKMGKSLPRFT